MRTLEAHKFQRVGESPETALDFSTLVALELGTHAKASGVPELTAFELNGVERIEMRCESRPEGPTVWFVDYEFSSNSIPASETVARLVAKYGPPAWKSDDALGGAPALDWSPVPIRNDSVLSNTPRLRYGGSKTDGQFTLRLQEGFDLHDAYKEELKQAVAIAAHGKQTGPHF